MVLLIQYTLLFASVLLLVALGGCFSEHSGVINLGLEGIMVMGALGGALMMRYLPDGTPAALMVLLVILTSIIAGMLYSCLLAISAIHCNADQTIVGTAMNILGTAAATVIVKAINTAANPDDVSSTIQYVSAKKAFLVNIGSFEFNWFMLVAVIALVLSYITLYKTKFGLRLMACGEHPQAADSVGINVFKMRWAGVLISGRTSREEILKVLEKIAIPIGALITLITFVVLMHQLDDISTIGPNLVVCILSLAYAVVEYLAVVLVRERIEK